MKNSKKQNLRYSKISKSKNNEILKPKIDPQARLSIKNSKGELKLKKKRTPQMYLNNISKIQKIEKNNDEHITTAHKKIDFNWTFADFYTNLKKALKWDKKKLDLNDEQKKAVENLNKPLWIIAGPGSGKTEVLVWKSLKLIFVDNIPPDSIIITTFTEKAAKSLRNRISAYISSLVDMGYIEDDIIDVNQFKIGTLHALCNNFMLEFRYQKYQNIKIMDEIEKILFIKKNCSFGNPNWFKKNEKFIEYFNISRGGIFNQIKDLSSILDRLIEDRIDLDRLNASTDKPLKELVNLYNEYQEKLEKLKRIDFSHIQSLFLEFLSTDHGKNCFGPNNDSNGIQYLLVDEYQDTNPVQEDIYFNLTEIIQKNTGNYNICVVGDDDQALYRFRGSSVDHLVNFNSRIKDKWGIEPEAIQLKKNYRSHNKIVTFFNEYARYYEDYQKFRANDKKDMISCAAMPSGIAEDNFIPIAVFNGKLKDCSNMIVNIIKKLKDNKIISGYHDVAILMRSVKDSDRNAGPIIQKFKETKIPFYNPRSRAVHESKEVKLFFGILINIINPIIGKTNFIAELYKKKGKFSKAEEYLLKCYETFEGLNPSIKKEFQDYIEKTRGDISQFIEDFEKFIDKKEINDFIFGKEKNIPVKFEKEAKKFFKYENGKITKNLREYYDLTIQEIFFKILNTKYFQELMKDMECSLHLAKLSQMLDSYSLIYSTKIKLNLKEKRISRSLITSVLYTFFNLLSSEGVNEIEDQNYTVIPNKVQILTYHQAKGLEFPIVFMRYSSSKPDPDFSHKIENILYNYRKHKLSTKSITMKKKARNDMIRIYYVGLSRAKYALFIFGTGDTLDETKSKNSCNVWVRILGYSKKKTKRSTLSWLNDSNIPYIHL